MYAMYTVGPPVREIEHVVRWEALFQVLGMYMKRRTSLTQTDCKVERRPK